ncbi:hypothetical protein GQ55_6G031100 [Panicum hallii var. hallii]|uniref:HTH myb-type domain-containing protein n=1 Tax=Panicum hallii var. hallii TaxID=1504633 RepID=A0A2T7D3E0_9POAL|nr:hypothetical protein GQ55_6G031100 [Panicum hallii var. hallii]
MTRDGVPPAAAGGAGGGDGPRRCSQCGHHGHNARTCTARPVKLFGVRIGDKPMPIRKSASMGNLAQLAAEGGGSGGREEGYGSDGERPHKKRGEAWTEDEHKKFLLGLNKLGKGDWRGISRNFVISRTPTQVASHAQKYFNRQTNVHRRKRRSSLFDMVIDDSSDQLPLSRSSSQEVEQDDPQSVAALPAPVVSPAAVAPTPVSVEAPASIPPPVQVPVPVATPQPMEQDSVASSSSAGQAGVVMPEATPPYLYPMMIPPPYYHPAFVPVPCYGYVPFYYGPPGVAQVPHEVVKPVAVHSTPPLNVKDLYNMSELSLKGDDSNANSGVPASPLPPKPIGRPERQSAFHGKGPAGGSSGGLIPAVK